MNFVITLCETVVYKGVMKTFFLLFILFINFFSLSTNAESFLPVQGKDFFLQKDISLSPANKKALVVVFLSSRCPCSNSHVTELKNLANEYPDFNYVAVHSNFDEDADVAKKYFKDQNFPFPVIKDEKAKLADQFKAFKTPHAFIIDANGKILYQGGISNSADCQRADRFLLREALVDLHNDKKVRTPEGRTLGCIILREQKNVF